ncbi:MAG: hypothetical protein HRF49_10300 [bacterium]
MSKLRVPEPECVQMKRRASLKVHKKLSGMTREEVISYWDKRAAEMIESQKSIKNKVRADPAKK